MSLFKVGDLAQGMSDDGPIIVIITGSKRKEFWKETFYDVFWKGNTYELAECYLKRLTD